MHVGKKFLAAILGVIVYETIVSIVTMMKPIVQKVFTKYRSVQTFCRIAKRSIKNTANNEKCYLINFRFKSHPYTPPFPMYLVPDMTS